MIKRLLLMAVIVLTISACMGPSGRYGYKSYDPCIRCGEGWTFIPHSQQP